MHTIRCGFVLAIAAICSADDAAVERVLSALASGLLDGERVGGRDALDQLDANLAVADKVATASVGTAFVGPFFDQLNSVPMANTTQLLGVTVRNSYAERLRKFVERACSGEGGPVAARVVLDVRLVELRVKCANGTRFPAAAAVKLAEDYAAAAAEHDQDSGLLARAVRTLDLAFGLDGADPAALVKRMVELSAKGDPTHPVFKLGGFRQRLMAHGKNRKELGALEAEVRTLADVADVDSAVLRLHREIVSTLRRAKGKTAYLHETRALLDAIAVDVPRGAEWACARLKPIDAASVTRSADDGSRLGHFLLSYVKDDGKQAAKTATQLLLNNFSAELKNARGSKKPKRGRLNKRIGSCWTFRIQGLLEKGHAVVLRGYAWRDKKTGRTYMMVAYARADAADDPELASVLASFRPAK